MQVGQTRIIRPKRRLFSLLQSEPLVCRQLASAAMLQRSLRRLSYTRQNRSYRLCDNNAAEPDAGKAAELMAQKYHAVESR